MSVEARLPVEWRCLHEDPLPVVDLGMTNFDHTVAEGLPAMIGDGQHMADYPGWNFHAYVYLGAEGFYVADVHVHHSHAAFISARSLEDLMVDVSNEYGWD